MVSNQELQEGHPPEKAISEDERVRSSRAHKGNGHSFGYLLRELSGETSALLRGELALARNEIEDKVTDAQRGVSSMAAGGAVLAAGLLGLMACAILALSLVWPAWLSALVVGGVVTLVGLILVMAGRSKTSASHLKPEQTIRSLRDTKRFATAERHKAKENWR